MPYMYILRCRDGSFYVGSTIDLERRCRIDDAFVREKQVQNWGRAKRIALIEGRFDDLPRLSSSG